MNLKKFLINLLMIIFAFSSIARRELWWLKNNPANPVVKYIMYRKNLKLAKELREKINKHLEAKE